MSEGEVRLEGNPKTKTPHSDVGNNNAIVSLTKKSVCVGHLFPAAREACDSDAA